MVIVGNIGNTYCELACCDEQGLISKPVRIATDDLLNGSVPDLMEKHCNAEIWLASVVPEAKTVACFQHANWVSVSTCPMVDFGAVDASTLGADRVANCAAAVKEMTLPALIVDCGTAITFELVDDRSAFCGGAILPGRKLMRSALKTGTAQLPELPLDLPIPSGAGLSTKDAMTLGIDRGIIGAVEAVRQHILCKLPGRVKTFITGGDARFFLDNLDDVSPTVDYFTLKGVAAIAMASA